MIAIVDCGIGNLRSVHKAFERGTWPDPRAPRTSRGTVVLPGREPSGLLACDMTLEPVLEFIVLTPIPGICLGLKLLMTKRRVGCYQGMNILQGRVRRFHVSPMPGTSLRSPMGWNQARGPTSSILTASPSCSLFCACSIGPSDAA
jgi:glutamine amidotransferase